MHIGKHVLNNVLTPVVVMASMGLLYAQQGGFLSGEVHDRSGLPVPGAVVYIQNGLTGARQEVVCDAKGHYISSELAGGNYKVSVRSKSFRTASRMGIAVEAGSTQVVHFVIELLPLVEEVTVQSATDDSDPTANGLALTRESSLNTLPLNGRDLHGLYSLVPGAVVTPAASSDGGQFTVVGQRPNTNSFRVDGVSGNTGLGLSPMPGTFTGSTLPGMTAIGSTQTLVSKEEIQRVDMRPSDFAPEHGGRPGALVMVETRSGSNDFHMSVFGYLRPESLDSNDWFASHYKQPLPAASLHGLGASAGGTLWPDHTFFFLAAERVNVNDSALQIMPAPSISARSMAPPQYLSLLDAFPLPFSAASHSNEGIAAAPLTKNADVQNYSARMDQILGPNARLFARFADAPSNSITHQLERTDAQFAWKSVTAGATIQWKGIIHDVRFNYSFVHAISSWPGNAGTAGLSLLTPGEYYSGDNIVTAVSIGGIGQVVSGYADNSIQRQYEGAYTAARQVGRHDLRAGFDFVQLLPQTVYPFTTPSVSFTSPSVDALVAGDPLQISFSGGRYSGGSGHIPIGSAFAQDTFKVTDRLSLLYGLRWEITHPSDSAYSSTLSFGTWNGATPQLLFPLGFSFVNNIVNWPMRYGQVAPRFGAAYRFKKPEIVFRVGGGLFYDDALGSLIDPVNLSPISWSWIPGGLGALPGFPGQPAASDPVLSLPAVWEWRVTAEKAIGARSTASLSYVGSAGRKLLREQTTLGPDQQTIEGFGFSSAGTSDFDAFEAQYRGQLTPRITMLANYTWGHSIDTGSQDSAIFWTGPGYPVNANRGSSSFDLRHNVTASVAYRLPESKRNAWWSGWSLSSTLYAHTGFPFDVTTVDRAIGLGFANTDRPDLIAGVPLWIPNSSVPGGRELNPAAFQTPEGSGNGTLGRNALTGFGAFQIDASLRRQFRFVGSSVLEVNASAYNVFNQANFANPVSYIGSALFGQSTSMQNLMLGSGGPNSGLTPMFQQGGPRTAELSLKFSF